MGPTDREKCARHQWKKGEQGWNNETMKHTNCTKFTQIHVKFVQISHNLLYSHPVIHVKFVRISYQFQVSFVRFGNEGGKHTSKHTLQSHGHVIDHAPAFKHFLGHANCPPPYAGWAPRGHTVPPPPAPPKQGMNSAPRGRLAPGRKK